MELALLVARLVLAGVFIVAGAAKLADRDGSTEAMEGFGVPTPFAAPMGILLPLAELAVAVALIPTVSARWGALGALALLLVFVAGIGFNLARGKQPDCHCFGQLHSEPAGWPTLARNGMLALLAVFILWQGKDDAGASTVAWLRDLSTADAVLTVASGFMLGLLAIQGWALIQLMQQNGRLLLRIDALENGKPGAQTHTTSEPPDGLPIGSPAPTFTLPDVSGKMVSLNDLMSAAKPVMLVFINPNCKKCTALVPDISSWQRDYAHAMTIALISRGGAEANRAKTEALGLHNILLQKELEVARAYQLTGTPTAVLVHSDGSIGSPLAAKADAIRALVEQTVAVPPRAGHNGKPNGGANDTGLPGAAAPDVRLTTLDGEQVQLSSYLCEPTALLFWNPGCGFCARMLDNLKQVETTSTKGSPRILVISTGDPERNRTQGLQSTVLLDQGFAAGRLFGATGTPGAVLIDGQGRVASTVATGAPSVLSLVTGAVPAGVSG